MIDLKKYLTQKLFSDIEAKGFWDDVNTPEDIWCLCSVTEDDEVLLFHNFPEFDNVVVWDEVDQKEYTIPPRAGTLLEGVRFWYRVGMAGGVLSVHNLCTYDQPVIEKIWPKCIIPDSSWEDTFVLSKVQWFDRPCPKGAKSAHGLKAYGIKFGVPKPDVTDWKTMDAYKLHRCIEDCRIQKRTSIFLEKEACTLKSRYGIDFTHVIETVEKPYARFCHEQEVNGAKVDREHIVEKVKWLDEETGRLAEYIEPRLPKTLKQKTGRVGRADITFALLGKTVPEELDAGGEVIKRYYKPHVNFTNKADVAYYEGFHITYGESPRCDKLSVFREWVKSNHPDTKVKEWEYSKIVIEGKKLNAGTCNHFDVESTDLDIIVGPHTRFTLTDSTLTQHEVVKGYLITKGIRWAEIWNLKKVDKSNVKAEEDTIIRYPPNANPNQQIVHEVKKGDFLVSSPKFGEKEYAQLGEDAGMGKDIAFYNTYMHRRRTFSNPKDPDNKGILAYIREDGRVPCGLGNFMTSSGRSNQRVIVNLPSTKALYGKEMRETIIAEEGKILIGVDQKSSQLSIAAFISNNEDYYRAVASGQQAVDGVYVGESAHCVNARNFGLVSEEEWKEAVRGQDKTLIDKLNMQRDKYAKSCSFGVIFGCSGKKLGLMLDVSAKEGNDKKNLFLKQMGLDNVIAYVKRCSEQFKYGGGFYIPVMGYWLWCKSVHVGVNYFCQGLEAVVQKIATLKFLEKLEEAGLRDSAKVILGIHDELLAESNIQDGDKVGQMMCDCYTWAGEEMLRWYKANEWAFPAGGTPKICVDFAGGYALGRSYYECH